MLEKADHHSNLEVATDQCVRQQTHVKQRRLLEVMLAFDLGTWGSKGLLRCKAARHLQGVSVRGTGACCHRIVNFEAPGLRKHRN